ncbi:MAG: zinc-binding dehydrogenase [Atopobiaceae bacterium]|jgi:threonine dehydrogenase-like Zn-dependent dehydrogenase|nr:zinc-binding dehydrogenase [Atopobiaceae bacterium]MCI1318719.1 zinc-binding dehydrogenase [Atopobiaceae bacterium]MCI1388218.1 zinc-binding dehydrogenase [Atopobiaceae bacterium]MCI1431532.1 zinc-binding dehydrogenase [Atopobiaceae bacterium]MCI1469968.1 zinc-binding dehydrogenase [Atopobiaceae bacterium]
MAEKMDIVVIPELNKAEVRTVDKPEVQPGKVLVRILGCALCTFEQRMFTGVANVPKPFIGGHEVTGVIAAVGEGVDEKQFPVGKHVAARTFYSCGHCYACRHDEGNLCENGNEADRSWMAYPGIGGLQQYMLLDRNQIYMINDDLPLEKACFAEPLACVLNSIERGHLEIGEDVVVIGGGIMGQLHVMCAKLSGCRVIMSEPDGPRRELAKKLGADICIDPTQVDAVEEVKRLTDGEGAAAVFNTTAVSAVAQQAIGMVAKLGTVVMYSSQHPDKPIEVSPGWLHNSEANITGAVSPSIRSFRRSVNALSKGIIDPELLVSGVFDYHDCQKAFETAIRPDTFRCIIKF